MSEEKLTMDNIHSNGRWTTGGNGSHWEGCEEVHWDCKIVALTARIAELEAENRWIPVSERLPEKDVWVLLHDRIVSGVDLGYSAGNYWIVGGKQSPTRIIPATTYTHWRPLPSSPEVTQ